MQCGFLHYFIYFVLYLVRYFVRYLVRYILPIFLEYFSYKINLPNLVRKILHVFLHDL